MSEIASAKIELDVAGESPQFQCLAALGDLVRLTDRLLAHPEERPGWEEDELIALRWQCFHFENLLGQLVPAELTLAVLARAGDPWAVVALAVRRGDPVSCEGREAARQSLGLSGEGT